MPYQFVIIIIGVTLSRDITYNDINVQLLLMNELLMVIVDSVEKLNCRG